MKTDDNMQPVIPENLSEIAAIIRKDWNNICFGASPYLTALADIQTIDQHYGEDSARSVVAYFLANARAWRGPTARAVKAKLNAMLAAH